MYNKTPNMTEDYRTSFQDCQSITATGTNATTTTTTTSNTTTRN